MYCTLLFVGPWNGGREGRRLSALSTSLCGGARAVSASGIMLCCVQVYSFLWYVQVYVVIWCEHIDNVVCCVHIYKVVSSVQAYDVVCCAVQCSTTLWPGAVACCLRLGWSPGSRCWSWNCVWKITGARTSVFDKFTDLERINCINNQTSQLLWHASWAISEENGDQAQSLSAKYADSVEQ